MESNINKIGSTSKITRSAWWSHIRKIRRDHFRDLQKSSAWYGELSVEAVEQCAARYCPERGESPNVFYSACHSILASRLGRPIILHLHSTYQHKEKPKMPSAEEKIKTGGIINGAQTNLLEEMKLLKEFQDQSGTRKAINSELWYACAGPLVSLPQVGSLVYYFPQGHSEQVAVSTKRSATSQIPNYPNLPSQLLCQVHNVTLHADKDTDEIHAQMSLQPVNSVKLKHCQFIDLLPIYLSLHPASK
ncbi:hypothetical protein NC652_005293 [Populus alba x Populus x berolinensis]|nr:hypothetical protein NC652_005293 [Populus alba x Populus x berolinensis]